MNAFESVCDKTSPLLFRCFVETNAGDDKIVILCNAVQEAMGGADCATMSMISVPFHQLTIIQTGSWDGVRCSSVKPPKEKPSVSRRNVLKSLGAAAVIGGGVLSSARVSALTRNRGLLHNINNRSLQILEKTNSPQKRYEFLRDHGIKVASVQNTYSMPTEHGSDGVEPMKVPMRDLEIHLTMLAGQDPDEYVADLSFQYEMGPGDYGEHPWDIAAMGWDPSWWTYSTDYVNTSTYAGGPTTIGYRNDTNGNGVAFNVDDVNLSDEQTSDWFWCGVNLRQAGFDEENRRVYGEFTHTWNEGYIDSVSVGWRSISVTFEHGTRSWDTGIERDGEFLIVSENDVGPCERVPQIC